MQNENLGDDVKLPGSGEAIGYLATVAFLVAYLLNTADAGEQVQFALNLSGAAMAATYLYRKHAVPAVVSNIVWGVITLAGAVLR